MSMPFKFENPNFIITWSRLATVENPRKSKTLILKKDYPNSYSFDFDNTKCHKLLKSYLIDIIMYNVYFLHSFISINWRLFCIF